MHARPAGLMLALALAFLAPGCRSAPPALDPGPAHVGAGWYAFRAAQLGLDEAAARERDAALSTELPAETRADSEMRREAAALWRDLCASCHGARGRVEDTALPDADEVRDWGSFGSDFAFLVAGDGLRAVVYRRIAVGGDREGNPNAMPGWSHALSREQIWALVSLIESF